jgi:hypothetical protein
MLELLNCSHSAVDNWSRLICSLFQYNFIGDGGHPQYFPVVPASSSISLFFHNPMLIEFVYHTGIELNIERLCLFNLQYQLDHATYRNCLGAYYHHMIDSSLTTPLPHLKSLYYTHMGGLAVSGSHGLREFTELVWRCHSLRLPCWYPTVH